MDNKVKLGIIGFGRVVELIHLPVLKKMPEIEVGGVFDITPQRLAVAENRGFAIFSEAEELLASPLDAVLIATPPNSHYQMAAAALRYGKHVIMEKPITLDAAEAIRLKEIADETHRTVTVFQNRRFDNDYLFARKMIAEGTLGEIQFVERRYHCFGSGASFGVKSFHPEWRNEKAYGGGALLDWGVHLVDQLLHLGLGACAEAEATMKSLRWQQGDVDDYVHVTMTTDQQVLLSIDINFASSVPSPLWIVGGNRATLQIMSDHTAYLYEKGKQVNEFKLEKQLNSGVHTIYKSFVDCIQDGGKLAVTLEEAVETMKVLDQIRCDVQQRKEMTHGNLVLGSSI